MLYSVANLRLSVAVSVTLCIVAKLRVYTAKVTTDIPGSRIWEIDWYQNE